MVENDFHDLGDKIYICGDQNDVREMDGWRGK